MDLPRIVAVVGAGNMGAGIAQKIAQEGFQVLLADMNGERARAGRDKVANSLSEAVARKVLNQAAADATLARVTAVEGLPDLGDADLVIEAIFEDLLVKKDLFRKLDAICKSGAVLATNTSSFYVHELASVTRRPGHVVGLHYFYHPAKNRLLEVIPGPLTDEGVVEAMEGFAEAHGKTGLRCTDSPGFVVNRFFVPWLNEAVRLLAEGVADIPSIEAACKATFGIGMGPFQLMNVTGIPVALHAAGTLGTELGPFYEPSDRLREQVESGALWPLDGEADPSVADAVETRMLGVVFSVAGALIDESVCSREDVDRGARIGLRWAAGPFELMNRVGVARALEITEQTEAVHPDLAPPDCLIEQSVAGTPWTFQRVDLRVRDGIATITINRPEVMNALDPEVVGQLASRLDEALATKGLRGIVLAGAGKAFVAGADIAFFVSNIKAGDLDAIQTFTEDGQRLLRRLETAPVPVIARVQGMALGGGVEVALACHGIVCSTKASFTLPETGIGIYPGLGGTQRLPRKVATELARRLVMTGRPLGAKQAVAAGLALQAVPITELNGAIHAWFDAGVPGAPGGPAASAVPAAEPAVAELYADSAVAGLLAGSAPDGLSEAGAALAEKDLRGIGRKAPLALNAAVELIDAGSRLDLDAALQLELDGLRAIFGTADALIGLSSVLERQRPSWTGA